jgi:thiamine biosynthesis lipoprotein
MKYRVIQDKAWSHIFDPRTGYPQRDVVSAAVIAPTAMEADTLATALCVLGRESGTKYINTLSEQYASLIMTRQESGEIQQSPSRDYSHYP